MKGIVMEDSYATVSGVEVSTDHWINGRRVSSSERFSDISPVDGSVLAHIAIGDESQVGLAVEAARAAFPAWAALGPEGRQPILHRLAQGILDRVEDLAAVETMDNGSLLQANLHRLMPRAAENITFFADWAVKLVGGTIDSEAVVNHIVFDPAGVAALIAPWNAPFMLTTWKLGPALAAGNTVVIKAPERAPLTSSILVDIARDAGVPAGVINLVHGDGPGTGNTLVNHPGVDRISFTGSTDTARIIGEAAARNLVPLSAELGGKSAFIVCDDADLELAAQWVVGQYMNAGQVCLAGTRLMVEQSIAPQFLDMVRQAMEGFTVGDPRDPATRMGPLINRDHYDRVSGFVERAKAAGAEVLWGGEGHEAGDCFYRPTMLSNVDVCMEIVQEEVFGPVLTWRTFNNDDQVVAMANETSYGLAGALFSRNQERAMRIASRVVTGTIWINCFYVRDLAAPFGGVGKSGIGREGGNWSFDFYCNIKNISVSKDSFSISTAHSKTSE
ncbi:MAG: aldehyde dehydrogenase [Haliea sp.]